MDYVTEAKALGFTDAALMPVRELVIVPEYRVFCEENLCGNYNVLPACPPASGTVEEMTARVRQYETALVLMIEHTPKDYTDRQEQKAAKRHQNELTEQLIGRMHENGTTDTLMMGAALENGLVHVGLLRERAEDGGLCRHEVLGERREDPLFLACAVLNA